MAADDDDLVRKLATSKLADDVCRVRVRQEMRLHPEANACWSAAVLHALQPFGILVRDGGRRDLWLALDIAERAGVRRAESRRADGSNQRGNRAQSARA